MPVARLVSGTLALLALAAPAGAQSLSPMRRELVSFEERFAVRLAAGNPSESPQTLAMRVFDEDWVEIADAWVSRPLAEVAPGGRVEIIVIAPFLDGPRRSIRVCAEGAPSAVPRLAGSAQVRGRVCGFYRAQRVE